MSNLLWGFILEIFWWDLSHIHTVLFVPIDSLNIDKQGWPGVDNKEYLHVQRTVSKFWDVVQQGHWKYWSTEIANHVLGVSYALDIHEDADAELGPDNHLEID